MTRPLGHLVRHRAYVPYLALIVAWVFIVIVVLGIIDGENPIATLMLFVASELALIVLSATLESIARRRDE